MSTASASVRVQRHWRGFSARRRFTELIFAAFHEQSKTELSGSDDNLLVAEDAAVSNGKEAREVLAAATPPVVRALTPSLEEALEDARSSQFLHPGSPRAGPPPPLQSTSAESSSDNVLPSPSASLTRANGAPSSPCASSGAASALTPAGLARMGNMDSNLDSVPTAAEDLQFTEELAANMSVEALRELASVLGRLSASRNKLLVTLLEKRDELIHEREYRQTLVEQLLMQVDRSRSLRKAKPAKR